MYLKNINNHILKLTDEEKNDLINDLQSSKTNFHTQSDAYVSNHESTLENINDQISEKEASINNINTIINDKKNELTSLKSNLTHLNEELECEICNLKETNSSLINSLSDYQTLIDEINEKLENLNKLSVIVDEAGDDNYLDKEELENLIENEKIDEETVERISKLDFDNDGVEDIDQAGVFLPSLAKIYDDDDTVEIFTN